MLTPQRGTVLGNRYELTDHIATGGMGEVWAATDTVLRRAVAVKILRDALTDSSEFIERFRAEARHAASLTHPGIASVFDYGEDQSIAFLVMELVPGEPLSRMLAREGALPINTALSLLAQTGEALHAAHTAGVIHRDVKPGNLLILPDGTVKVTDFGIARAVDSVPLTATGQIIGTAQYMAPEQASGGAATAASDVYSLGVIGYEMLAGVRPFLGDSPVAIAMAHLHQSPPPLPASVPATLRSVIERALAKSPADRPVDAMAFANEVRRIQIDTLAPPAVAAAVLGAGQSPATSAALAASTSVMPANGIGSATSVMPAGGVAVGAPLIIVRDPLRRRRRKLPGALLLILLAIVGVALALRAGDGGVPARAFLAAASTTTMVETTPAPTTVAPKATPPPPTPPADVAVTAPGIVVDPNALIGQKRDKAVKMLQTLGFRVDQRSVSNSDADKNTIVGVEPSGTLARGSLVTLLISDGD